MTSSPHVQDPREHSFATRLRRRTGAARALRACACLAVFALLAASWSAAPARAGQRTAPAAESESTEYEVKAVFLQRITTPYVKWPETAFASPTAPFVVAVLGKDPFGKLLDDVFAGKKVGEHSVKLVRFASVDELDACHMLFVTRAQEKHLEKIKKTYEDKPVLLVAESISAAESGAQIGVYIESARLRFAINATAAKEAKLEISSELLKLAKVVGSKGGK